MKCFQSCPECPKAIRETDRRNFNTDPGDFEYYLIVRSVHAAAVRLGYGWPERDNKGVMI